MPYKNVLLILKSLSLNNKQNGRKYLKYKAKKNKKAHDFNEIIEINLLVTNVY